MNTKLPKYVNIMEVGPRDGLQNEKKQVATDIKIAWIHQLIDAGISNIEVTSFVPAKWIPALSDHQAVMQAFRNHNGHHYFALIPNDHGLQSAINADCKYISVITAASETFTQKNTNCSIEESLQRIESMITIAKANHIFTRAYISCTLGCPYEGYIHPKKTARIAAQLLQIGCDEIVLADTIGIGTPNLTEALVQSVATVVPIKKLAIHFHDTYGLALANIYTCLQMGIATIDSSAAGLGGCPYAKGASGNVATEDVVNMLNGLGIETGINLPKLIEASNFILNALGQSTRSKAAQAYQSKCTIN